MELNNLKLINFLEEKKEQNTIFYGFGSTLLGECLISYYEDNIYYLSFSDYYDVDKALILLKQEYENYNFILDQQQAKNLIKKIFDSKSNVSVNVVVKGTAFQLRIWKELTKIPFGATLTYSSFANLIGSAKSTRAVANAVAKNKIAFFIPCHRIVSKNSKIHKYRWGSSIKKKILEYEADLYRSNIDKY